MLYQIYAIAVKELKILLRDPNGLVTLFALPLVFITVMTLAQSSAFDVITGDDPLEVLVVNQDKGDLAVQAIKDLYQADNILPVEELNGTPPSVEVADRLVAESEYSLAVIFPADFTERVLEAAVNHHRNDDDQAIPQATVRFIADPSASLQLTIASENTIKGYVQGSIAYAQIPKQVENELDKLIDQLPTKLAPFFSGEVEPTIEKAQSQVPLRVEQTSDRIIETLPSKLEDELNELGITSDEFEIDLADEGVLGIRFERTGPFDEPLVSDLAATSGIPVAIVNQDAGDLAAEVVSTLRATEGLNLIERRNRNRLTAKMAEETVAGGAFLAVIFPPDFSERVLEANPESKEALITYIINPKADPLAVAATEGIVSGLIQRSALIAQLPVRVRNEWLSEIDSLPAQLTPFLERTIDDFSQDIEKNISDQIDTVSDDLLTQLASKVGPYFNAQIRDDFIIELNAELPTGFSNDRDIDGVSFSESPPTGLSVQKRPNSVQQNVPAWTIFGIFFIVLTMANGLLREKQSGTSRRLLAAPLSPLVLLIGSLIPYYLVNLIQVAFMFTVGILLFDLNLGQSPIALLVVSMATSAVAVGLGLLVAAVSKSAEQVSGLSLLVITVFAAMGGIMVSRIFMPDFMQAGTHFTPHAWALDGYHDVIVRGLGLNAVQNEVAMLLGFALLFFSLALWRFRFD